jgi:hypothetical protein
MGGAGFSRGLLNRLGKQNALSQLFIDVYRFFEFLLCGKISLIICVL